MAMSKIERIEKEIQKTRVSCGAAVFDSLDKTDLIAYRKEDYQYKVLVKNRKKAERNYPKAIVEPATIEEIMLFHVKGELQ